MGISGEERFRAILASISNSSNVAYNLVELPAAPMSYSLNS